MIFISWHYPLKKKREEMSTKLNDQIKNLSETKANAAKPEQI